MKTCQISCSVDVSRPISMSLIYPKHIKKSRGDLRVFKSQLQGQLPYSNIFECDSPESDTIKIIGTAYRGENPDLENRFNLLIFSQVPEIIAKARDWKSNWQFFWEYLLRIHESNNYGHSRLAS